jgi:glycosyltransferase involved in cell wall biosynthesis
VPGEHLRLKIYGGSFHRQDYYQELELLQAGDTRIEFCGEYDFDNVAAVLQDIDVIVAPSLWYENAPLAISTAHAFGIPVITTNIGGMAEMVQDGVDGFTFRLGDSQDLSEKIQRFVLDPSLLATFEKEMRPPPRIEGEMLSLETLYQELIAGWNRNGHEVKQS